MTTIDQGNNKEALASWNTKGAQLQLRSAVGKTLVVRKESKWPPRLFGVMSTPRLTQLSRVKACVKNFCAPHASIDTNERGGKGVIVRSRNVSA